MLFERALTASAVQAGCPLAVVESAAVRWASATFVGARHRLLVSAEGGSAFEGWLAALPEAEFALRGHLVADLNVASVRRDTDGAIAEIEALTVEER